MVASGQPCPLGPALTHASLIGTMIYFMSNIDLPLVHLRTELYAGQVCVPGSYLPLASQCSSHQGRRSSTHDLDDSLS